MDARHNFPTGPGADQPRAPSRVARLLYFLGGSHADEAVGWPQPFRAGVMADGALVIASQLFVAAGVTTALVQIDVPPPFALLAGTAVGTVIGLVERATLDFDLSATADQRLNGAGIGTSAFPMARWAVGIVRVGFTAFAARFTASLLALGMFSPDIEAFLAREWQAANVVIDRAATRQVDQRIAEQQRVVFAATRLREERQALVSQAAASPVDVTLDREIAQRQQERTARAARIAEIDRKIASTRESRSAERNGVKLHADNSGEEGEGPLYKFHNDRLRDLETERAQLSAQDSDSGPGTAALIASRDQNIASMTARNQKIQPERERILADADRALARAKAVESQMRRHRKAMIEAEARADPNWRERETGLLARKRALDTLAAANPGVGDLITKLAMFLMAIELMPILRRLLARIDPLGGTLRLLGYRSSEQSAIAAYLARHSDHADQEHVAQDLAFDWSRHQDRRRAQRRRERRFRDFLDAPLNDPPRRGE